MYLEGGSPSFINVLYGVIGAFLGGFITLLWGSFDKYWISIRFGESVESRKKLQLYAKPLWLECHELEYRLTNIKNKLGSKDNSEKEGLKADFVNLPKDAQSFGWFTKEGYYITSTAYLIASVCCWVRLFQRDVVFLNFSNQSFTATFFSLIEDFKVTLSTTPSKLWYFYLNGIGEYLIQEQDKVPMTIVNFSYKLYSDKAFAEYYDQLFQGLRLMTQEQDKNEEYVTLIENTVKSLQRVKRFLESNKVVPENISSNPTRIENNAAA